MATYQHFVGSKYDNPTRFVEEAKRVGWSRNVNAYFARGLHYGDRIVFLRLLRNKQVQAFAEGRITSITFKDPTLSKLLTDSLVKEGKATYHPGSQNIQRECGSYLVIGAYEVSNDLDIPEITARAMAIAKEHNLDLACMIGGDLVRNYKPVFLQPAPKFTRGFLKATDDETFEAPDKGNSIIAIDNYRRK